MINQERYGDAAALVGRLFFSSMVLVFSYGKLTAFGGTSGYMASLGLPAPALFTLLAIITEIGGWSDTKLALWRSDSQSTFWRWPYSS